MLQLLVLFYSYYFNFLIENLEYLTFKISSLIQIRLRIDIDCKINNFRPNIDFDKRR